MAQQLANFAQRGTLAQHLGGQAVTKLMGSFGGGINAGALERMPNDGSNATRSPKAADRGFARAKTRAGWCWAVGHGADTRQSLCRPLRVRAGRCADRSCHAHSTDRCLQSMSSSSRNATSPARNPKSREQEQDGIVATSPSRYADRCCPATDVLDPAQFARGIEVIDQLATMGTAAARSSVISPQ